VCRWTRSSGTSPVTPDRPRPTGASDPNEQTCGHRQSGNAVLRSAERTAAAIETSKTPWKRRCCWVSSPSTAGSGGARRAARGARGPAGRICALWAFGRWHNWHSGYSVVSGVGPEAGDGWVGGWRGDVLAFRFQSPPVEPCVRFSRTRLTDALHRRCSISPARPGGAWVRRRCR
jgi:hypothetical protein